MLLNVAFDSLPCKFSDCYIGYHVLWKSGKYHVSVEKYLLF